MGSIHKHFMIYIHDSLPVPSSINPPPSSATANTATGFPIIAIAVLCIAATAFLLVSYYIILTKCCVNLQQLDPLRRFSFSRARRHEDPLILYSPSPQNHGLNEFLIRQIPTFQYTRGEAEAKEDSGGGAVCKCVVCLNEFQERETLRVLPNCAHAFHLDCIDVWLQSNSNCPLCRTSISGTTTRNPIDHRLIAPSSSPQDPQPFVNTHVGGDEDYVVIELSERRLPERRNESPGKLEQRKPKQRKCRHVSIMDDECIYFREKDDRFVVQPIRRSFSLDSAANPQVYLAVQEIIRQNRRTEEFRDRAEESSSRGRRSFFPFGTGRGSRSAVLPVEF